MPPYQAYSPAGCRTEASRIRGLPGLVSVGRAAGLPRHELLAAGLPLRSREPLVRASYAVAASTSLRIAAISRSCWSTRCFRVMA